MEEIGLDGTCLKGQTRRWAASLSACIGLGYIKRSGSFAGHVQNSYGTWLSNLPKVPLQLLPIITKPFDRVALDILGPFPKSDMGYQFMLVIMNYATHYPKAVPMQTVTKELIKWITRVRIPREILTDQGTNFVLKGVCVILKIRQLRTLVYHPQTDGLVEWFNHTLKVMIKTGIQGDAYKWRLSILPLTFTTQKVPQASLGYSPFQLICGRRPQGLLDLICEGWQENKSTSWRRMW